MKTFAFIDALNLFYGGQKSLGWKIDYQKLLKYLRKKYSVSRTLYFGGIDENKGRLKFYNKLREFGYELYLKPIKIYKQKDGSTKRKANCDVEMAFYMMKEKDSFERVLILSGDGDFLPLLEYMKKIGKEESLYLHEVQEPPEKFVNLQAKILKISNI